MSPIRPERGSRERTRYPAIPPDQFKDETAINCDVVGEIALRALPPTTGDLSRLDVEWFTRYVSWYLRDLYTNSLTRRRQLSSIADGSLTRATDWAVEWAKAYAIDPAAFQEAHPIGSSRR